MDSLDQRALEVQTPLAQTPIDPAATLAAGVAAAAAYADYARAPVTAPEGTTLVARFTGWEALITTGVEERFGLVFQSNADPSAVIISFRGTDSYTDWYQNAWINTAPFASQARPGQPISGVRVSSGFYGIYDAVGGAMAASMRGQLFGLLQRLGVRTVLVTGHSLGAALASLFMLDLAASLPGLSARAITFASPRVGDSGWGSAYDRTFGLRDRTSRILNYWDLVPSLPPAIFGYVHVGTPFLVSFYVESTILPNYLSRHSLTNHQTVLGHAVYREGQVWIGTFPDAVYPAQTMVSTAPPSATPPEWAERDPAISRALCPPAEGAAQRQA